MQLLGRCHAGFDRVTCFMDLDSQRRHHQLAGFGCQGDGVGVHVCGVIFTRPSIANAQSSAAIDALPTMRSGWNSLSRANISPILKPAGKTRVVLSWATVLGSKRPLAWTIEPAQITDAPKSRRSPKHSDHSGRKRRCVPCLRFIAGDS